MKWYVLYTRPNHERAVYARLRQAFELYLPVAVGWQQSHKEARKTSKLLFPRYIFVRCYLEMYTHLELITSPGVMRLLENAQGEFLVVPDEEMHTLQQLNTAGVPFERVAYPIAGEWVQAMQGPLQGITGVIREGLRTALLVPIHSLRESIAVEISRAQVIPGAAMRDRRRT
jgi:transcription antitermination factor NusG